VQDPGRENMEIIVIDDFSTMDDPREVVDRIGKGRVQFIQQSENLGKARNFQIGLECARGFLIHLLHGDDCVSAGFYDSMEKAFDLYPNAGAFFCESEYIDGEGNVVGRTGKESKILGILDNWLEKLVVAQKIQTPAIVVRRQVYETLGGFDPRLDSFEDWEMWVRIAISFSFGFNPHTMAQYRVHPANTSSKSVVSGKRAQLLRSAISIMDSYLPNEITARCRADRSREAAHYLIRCIPQILESGKPLAWLRLSWAAIRFSAEPRVLYYLLLFTVRYKHFLAN
jgi:GT2 family glycosyltransferase